MAHSKKVSQLEVDRALTRKNILSRDSSMNCSSRIYYYRRNPDGVPFSWEMQPGRSKSPPKEEIVPPLSPPPAVLSLRLPKPCLDQLDEPKYLVLLRFKYFILNQKPHKKNPIKQQITDSGSGSGSSSSNRSIVVSGSVSSDRFLNYETCNYDDGCESMSSSSPSPHRNSYSSSYSSSFSTVSSRSSRVEQSPSRVSNPMDYRMYGCSPWEFYFGVHPRG